MTRLIFLVLLLGLTVLEFLNLHYKSIAGSIVYYLVTFGLVGGLAMLIRLDMIPQSFILVGLLPTLLLTVDLFKAFILRTRANAWIYSLFYAAIPILCLISLYNEPYFRELVIGCLLLIWVSDIGAYFVGKSIGKHKLMPSVSPGKTREGFFGAGMLTIISSYLMYNFLGHFTMQQWAIIALLVWLLGSIGDLVESKIKRQLNIKDSGNILPGHGGFLDRFDGFIFCLPAVSSFVYLISK